MSDIGNEIGGTLIDRKPLPMETFHILICHYCGEMVKDEGLTPGHVHVGEMEKHGHELPVFIPATVVEVNRRSERIKREQDLLDRLKVAEGELALLKGDTASGSDNSMASRALALLLRRMARECESMAAAYDERSSRDIAETERLKAVDLRDAADRLIAYGRDCRDGIDIAIARFTEIRRSGEEIGGDGAMSHRIRTDVIPVLEQLRKDA